MTTTHSLKSPPSVTTAPPLTKPTMATAYEEAAIIKLTMSSLGQTNPCYPRSTVLWWDCVAHYMRVYLLLRNKLGL